MKTLRNLILFALLASTQCAYSADSCDPCDPCYAGTECDLCNVSFCDMEFELYVDALYWHANADSNYPDGSNDALCFDYCWGWRIGGSAYWNTWDFGFRYTSIDPSFKRIDENGEFVEVYKMDLKYRVFDLEVGRACCICEGIQFRPFFGGKFADVKTIRDYDQGVESETYYERKFKGCGLYAGANVRWQICNFDVCNCNIPLALVSRASTGVMDGDFEQVEFRGDESIQKDCQFIPVHEVYAGLEFRMCGLCDADAFMQIGYEAQYWGWREDNNDQDTAHLGLGGLVLRFGANF